jgi:hypothetical protein
VDSSTCVTCNTGFKLSDTATSCTLICSDPNCGSC